VTDGSAHNAGVAAESGVGAEAFFVGPEIGVTLTRPLMAHVTMSPDLFGSRPGAPARAARRSPLGR
jgi:hypothetical protein